MIPRPIRRWLIAITVFLVFTAFYQAWTAADELEETLWQTERELTVARDSLMQAQLQIDYMVREIGMSQRALRKISEEVQRAQEQHEAQRAQATLHRQPLLRQWQKNRQTRQALHRAAQQYAVE